MHFCGNCWKCVNCIAISQVSVPLCFIARKATRNLRKFSIEIMLQQNSRFRTIVNTNMTEARTWVKY